MTCINTKRCKIEKVNNGWVVSTFTPPGPEISGKDQVKRICLQIINASSLRQDNNTSNEERKDFLIKDTLDILKNEFSLPPKEPIKSHQVYIFSELDKAMDFIEDFIAN